MIWRAIAFPRNGETLIGFYRVVEEQLSVRLNGELQTIPVAGSQLAYERLARIVLREMEVEDRPDPLGSGGVPGPFLRG